MTKPTKHGEKVKKEHAKVVTSHRLAGGDHSTVFPKHIGENHWHGGPRQGHPGSGMGGGGKKH